MRLNARLQTSFDNEFNIWIKDLDKLALHVEKLKVAYVDVWLELYQQVNVARFISAPPHHSIRKPNRNERWPA
jgi:hypothetical protein